MKNLHLTHKSSRSHDSSSNGHQLTTVSSEPVLSCTLIQMNQIQVTNKQEDDLQTSYNDVDDNHLSRDQERYSSYYSHLQLHESPFLGKFYSCQLQEDKMWCFSERWSDCFNDIMKLRMSNHISFHEDELIKMVYEILQGLKVLEMEYSNLKVLGVGRTPQSQLEPCELLLLNPIDIALVVTKRDKKVNCINFKVTNYMEHMLLDSQSKKAHLMDQIYHTEESLYYYPPELLVQLFLDLQHDDIEQKPEIDDGYDFEEESLQEEVKTQKKQQYYTCMFRGAVWSLGILILRCLHTKQGDYLGATYGPKRKLPYITDLLAIVKQTSESVYSPVPYISVDQSTTPTNSLQKWLSGSLQEIGEFSWPLRELVRQMLISNVAHRPSVSELLESPLFYGYLQTSSTQPPQAYEPVSLGVFLSLTKMGLTNQIAESFFSKEELIEFAKPILKRRMLINNTTKQTINISMVRSTIAQKFNQVCGVLRKDGVSKLTVEELIQRIGKISSLTPQKMVKQDEDSLSVKSEYVKKSTPDDDTKIKSPLTTNVLSRMNIFSRAGGGIFGSTKRSDSPGEQSLMSDSVSTNESQSVQLTPLTNSIGQYMLMKLLATASEKTFKAFMGKYSPFMGVEGVFWKGIRQQIWPRALQVENLDAYKEIIHLTLSITQCTMSAKWADYLQCEKDIPRCHQYNEFANSYHGKIVLTQVLKAFININATNFYLQGMDAMALVFLNAMNYDWELTVVCLQEFYLKKMISPIQEVIAQIEDEEVYEKINISKIQQNEQCTPEDLSDQAFKMAFNKKLQEKLLLYKWLLNFQDPQLLSHLECIGFLPEMYVVSWFTNFFAMDFEVNSVIRIWDYLLLQEDNFEVFFAVAIMWDLRETLLLKDSSGIMSCIKNLQGIISIDLCLKYAQHTQTLLPKNLIILTYTSQQVRRSMMETQNEFLAERPWETPPLFEQLQERICFEISVFDLLPLLRDARTHHPSFILMLDMRPQKSYEEVCIQGSLFSNYLSGKINNLILLKYLELKNQVTGSSDQFKDEIEVQQPSMINFNRKNSPAHKPLGFVVLIWDYETQLKDIGHIQNYLIDQLRCKKICVLKGGIQAAMVDGSEVIKFKNKTTMPIFIKKEMDDFKNI